jgi:hypothetical protein
MGRFGAAPGDNHTVSRDEPLLESRDGDTGLAVAWMLGVLLVAGLLYTVCLAKTLVAPFEPYTHRDFLRGEWLLLGTLLALPIYRASRTRWWTALPLAVVPSAQVIFIASSAVGAFERAGIAHATDRAWYVVAAAQTAVFATAAGVGAARNLADRRWLRLVKALSAEPTSAAVRRH